MKYLWRSRTATHSVSNSLATSVAPSTTASNTNLNEKYPLPPPPAATAVSEAVTAATSAEKKKGDEKKKSRPWKILGWSWTTSKTDNADLEKGPSGPAPRPIRLLAPVYGGLGAGLSICQCRSTFVESGLIMRMKFSSLVASPFFSQSSSLIIAMYVLHSWQQHPS